MMEDIDEIMKCLESQDPTKLSFSCAPLVRGYEVCSVEKEANENLPPKPSPNRYLQTLENQNHDFKKSASHNFKNSQNHELKESANREFKKSQSRDSKMSQQQEFKKSQSRDSKMSQQQEFKKSQNRDSKMSQQQELKKPLNHIRKVHIQPFDISKENIKQNPNSRHLSGPPKKPKNKPKPQNDDNHNDDPSDLGGDLPCWARSSYNGHNFMDNSFETSSNGPSLLLIGGIYHL
jgi:hypothetical protein